jgi:hypothetical protein
VTVLDLSCARDGQSAEVTAGGGFWDGSDVFPIRQYNRDSKLPKLSGCGMPYGDREDDGSTWTPVFAVEGEWRAKLASCESRHACDRCTPIFERESRLRWFWHFRQAEKAGCRLVHVALTVPHSVADDLVWLRERLVEQFDSLRRSRAWRRLQVADWVRIAHVRVTRVNGWHVHLHLVLIIRAGVEPDLVAWLPEVRAAWRKRLIGAGFKATNNRHGVFARVFRSALEALYPWHWAERKDEGSPYDPPDYEAQSHLDDLHSYEVDHGFDRDEDGEGSWSVWDLARAAIGGDAWAHVRWLEFVHATYGQQVVSCSDRLDEVWQEVGMDEVAAEVAATAKPPLPVDAEPVVLVGNKLVARAVIAGVWAAGLRAGSSSGVLAAAGVWAEALGCPVLVDVDARGVPLIWADSIGPPGSGAGSVSLLCSEADLVEASV